MVPGRVPKDCRGARAQVDLEGVDTTDWLDHSEKVGDPGRLETTRDRIGDNGRLKGDKIADWVDARLVVR